MSTDYEITEAATAPLLAEKTVINGKWEILGHIATGGKGEVYLANQVNLERKVALKIMSKAFVESLHGDKEELKSELDRFRREVMVMARLRHPNVIQVFDFDQVQIDGQSLDYIAMEYVPGSTLKLTMPEEGFGDDEERIKEWVRKFFLPVLDGVEAIHAAGIIHRDLKPANVLISDGVPKIADFGLAGGDFTDDVTKSHHILGTVPYMPEEQFLGLAMADGRADIYALGKILYAAVIGKLNKENSQPFKTAALPAPQTPFMKRLDGIIQQATARDRNERTPSVKDLRESLRGLIGDGVQAAVTKATRRTWVVAAVVVVLLLGVGLWYHFSNDEPLSRNELQVLSGEVAELESRGGGKATLFPTARPLPESIIGKDGATLRLVPGQAQNHGSTSAAVAPFYLGETLVTNHQFVGFLRSVPGVKVQDGTVMGNGEIWLILGEVTEGYEPILYQNGAFVLPPTFALNPVVRVTALGAQAYARHYGLTLPTKGHWNHAEEMGGAVTTAPSAKPQATITAPDDPAAANRLLPVIMSPPNALGVRGLGKNVREWVRVPGQGDSTEFHVVGGMVKDQGPESHLRRQPWEAFFDVGFRTALTSP
ncbi:MAG: serine/threonine protein kinase [Deltaproteobacteria bacterium HGW-Deltaproteobacteria-8]|jgi:serine/threonine-protein kinase|nr:MAG: serine/threonine protein kinase [Deltaproteobacteria bacterium HGW-Deltaproteobacteria-8]